MQPKAASYATFVFDAAWQQVAEMSETRLDDPSAQAQLWADEIAFEIDIDLDGEIGGSGLD